LGNPSVLKIDEVTNSKKLVTNSYKLGFIGYNFFWTISLNWGGGLREVSLSLRKYP
jgi:hypothetical protein